MAYSDEMRDATLQALMSGASSGAVFGLGARLLGGAKAAKMADLIKAAGIGALTGGSVAGGSTLLGSSIMGPPEDDDPSAFTKRAGLGGLIGGGALGAVAGGLAARGKLRLPAKIPGFVKDYYKGLRTGAEKYPILKGALAGGAGLAIPAAYYASDEGMGTDFINNEMRARMRAQNGST